LAESDCVAVVQAGARTFTVPIYIQKGSGKAVIESDFTFNEARPNTLISVDGEKTLIVRFEKIPQPEPAAPEPIPPTETELFEAAVREEQAKNPGENTWVVRRRVNDRFFREGLGRQQQERQAAQVSFGTLPDKWAGFAAAAKRARNSR
jgi:hypothetical protein